MDFLDQTVASYASKSVAFRFRGHELRFHLSHALFSSADIDAGTRQLLRVVSNLIDEREANQAPIRTVLDAGCGVGVIGIAVAAALGDSVKVRAQDRDELARVFTAANARLNARAARKREVGNATMEILEAHAEPLLAGPADARYDLILSNLPAKAGTPVLADFFYRSSRMLNRDGRAAIVIVSPLVDSAREWLRAAEAPIVHAEISKEYGIFVYGAAPQNLGAANGAEDTAAPGAGAAGNNAEAALPPAYVRFQGDFDLEGVRYRMRTVHGAAGFDSVGRETAAAARLYARLGAAEVSGRQPRSILAYEDAQGHFSAWSAANAASGGGVSITLAGRNVVDLAAGRANVERNWRPGRTDSSVHAVPCADLGLCAADILARVGRFDAIAAFPESVPRTDRRAALWNAAETLLEPDGIFLIAAESTETVRFDKSKSAAFARAGDFKRDGCRAFAYRRR